MAGPKGVPRQIRVDVAARLPLPWTAKIECHSASLRGKSFNGDLGDALLSADVVVADPEESPAKLKAVNGHTEYKPGHLRQICISQVDPKPCNPKRNENAVANQECFVKSVANGTPCRKNDE